jgi:hypothetical protein
MKLIIGIIMLLPSLACYVLQKNNTVLSSIATKCFFGENVAFEQRHDHYTDIKKIELKHMDSLPPDIFLYKNLKEIAVLFSPKLDFAKAFCAFSQFDSLEILSINANEMRHLPPEIGLLTHLKELNLAGNLLTSLPIEIKHCKELKKIDLSCQHNFSVDGKQVINSLQFNTNLETLDFTKSGIKEIPTSIVALSKLQIVELQDNDYINMPCPAYKMVAFKAYLGCKSYEKKWDCHNCICTLETCFKAHYSFFKYNAKGRIVALTEKDFLAVFAAPPQNLSGSFKTPNSFEEVKSLVFKGQTDFNTWIQVINATLVKVWLGDLKLSLFLGLLFSLSCISAMNWSEMSAKLVFLGIYCLINPFRFSFAPLSQL